MRQSIVGFLEATSQEMQRRKSTTGRKTSMQEGLEAEQLAEENDGQIDEDADFQTPWQTAADLGALVFNVTAQNTPAPAPHETMVMCIIVIWTIIVTIVALAPFTPKTTELIVGVAVNINLFFFYGAPLSSILQVFTERNSASIHIRTMITNSLNSCFWTAYGLAVCRSFHICTKWDRSVFGGGARSISTLVSSSCCRREFCCSSYNGDCAQDLYHTGFQHKAGNPTNKL